MRILLVSVVSLYGRNDFSPLATPLQDALALVLVLQYIVLCGIFLFYKHLAISRPRCLFYFNCFLSYMFVYLSVLLFFFLTEPWIGLWYANVAFLCQYSRILG